MANNPCKLQFILIGSYAHIRSLELKAKFNATKDLIFKGLPDEHCIDSMTRMQGYRYLAGVSTSDALECRAYRVDAGTLTAASLELITGHGIDNSFVDGEYMLLVVRLSELMIILKDLVEIDCAVFAAKYEYCKNGHVIRGSYAQQSGHSVYAVDRHSSLYRIEWQDIKDGKYLKTLVKEDVVNFYVDGRLGLATLNWNSVLSLPSGTEVDLKAKVGIKARWAIVACIAKCWIACGERDLMTDGHAIMASVSDEGEIRSTLTLKLTSNGYVSEYGRKFAGIYSLHNVFTRGRRGIMLAIERDGCCHLISVTHGRMSKLQSVASIVNVDVVKHEKDRIVHSVTATGTRGEFIVGGNGWTRLISLKLK